ncbi:FKBP-type peptidyl-prolyl cis-trans isomerase [Candidatus Saccharibacteria bacterium]|nr:FKBP-type peptidyl-prolyl cis-trans isomerase [Candidatus Saccharibacteria bacterium]
MESKQLKTSWQQRIVIGIIAFLLLFSTVAVYALIVLSNQNSKKTNEQASKELAKVEEELTAKRSELEAIVTELSGQYYEKMSNYRSKVRSYNAATVNNAGLTTSDLETGSGEEITAESSYYSYYIGWCADESVFDSSFDSWENPTTLIDPIAYTNGESQFVQGWEDGVVGMKIGGVREISIPGELAYGETKEICGGTNSPLKFIIMAVDPGDNYTKKLAEYNELMNQYYVLYYSQNQDLLNSTEE